MGNEILVIRMILQRRRPRRWVMVFGSVTALDHTKLMLDVDLTHMPDEFEYKVGTGFFSVMK